MIHTLLVKYFNDLLDGQKSERSIDKVTYFYVGDLFCIHLGTKYANFQEKIFADISGRKLQTLCIFEQSHFPFIKGIVVKTHLVDWGNSTIVGLG